jgi:hypothetical protein
MITKEGQRAGLGLSGTEVRLLVIWDSIRQQALQTEEEYEVNNLLDTPFRLGMYCSNDSRDSWCNLEGHCDNYHGFWVGLSGIFSQQYLIKTHNAGKETSQNKVRWVKTDVMFKGKSLIGKKCKLIKPFKRFSSTAYFVEFEDHIGGGSCDGLGKSGHCLPVNSKFLVKSPKQVENVNEKYIEALKCISI